MKLVDGNDDEWEMNQLLFADDTVVVAADSEEKLSCVSFFQNFKGFVREGSCE